MKFLYEYQDKANKRHTGSLNAPTRAAAYSALKAQGIKPIHCDEAPGLFNLVFGRSKRWIAIAVLALVCVLLAIIVGRGVLAEPQIAELASTLDSPVRRQLIGDAAVIEKGIRTGWADMFTLEGDRFLASFAVPGTVPAVSATTEEKLKEALDYDGKVCRSATAEECPIEARQIHAIVSGMKRDIAALRKEGWTLREVGTALVQRQGREISYYERAKTEINEAKRRGVAPKELEQILEKRNASLRAIGVRPVSMPITLPSKNW